MIQGYNDFYMVSNTGRVKSLPRTITCKNGKIQNYPEKVLKTDNHSSNTTTYARVSLSKNGKVNRVSVHRLVAEAFIPNPYDKPCVNHKDNNGLNNHVDNLEWVTHSENMLHAQKQGRLFNSQSKGGKVGGLINHTNAVSNCNSMIGNTFGEWKVLEYLGIQGKGEGKHYVLCKCLNCNLTIQRVQATRLTRGESKNCRRCGQTKRKI